VLSAKTCFTLLTMAERHTPITELVLPETDRNPEIAIEHLPRDDENLQAYLEFMYNSLRKFYRPTRVPLRAPLYVSPTPGSQQISELRDHFLKKPINPRKPSAIKTVWIAREVATSAIIGALEIQSARASNLRAAEVPIIRELVAGPSNPRRIRSLVSAALPYVALSHFSGQPGTIGAGLKLYARMNDTGEVQEGVDQLINHSRIFRPSAEIIDVRLQGRPESWREARYTAHTDLGITGILGLLLNMSPELQSVVPKDHYIEAWR